ncbi:MAG TPA: pyridoxamine 5'-phosphate oxidase [Actinomycetota bacterium]
MAVLHERDLDPDPVAQFHRWFDEAREAERQPDAMALATASPDGEPSVRMVLLKRADHRGLTFGTNFGSSKGRDLSANPRAAVAFHWVALHRQVRAWGTVERCADEESDVIWEARPRGARLAAASSRQSESLPDRDALERAYAEAAERYPGDDVPRPPWWGGYLLVPAGWEFWQGQENRLHDRVRYDPDGAGGWRITRLAP